MFTLDNLQKVVTTRKQVVGRGNGSNRGKNAGKGNKGQTKRGHVPIYFTGVINDAGGGLMSRIPKTKGFTARPKKQFETLYIERIADVIKDGVVDIKMLMENGLIGEKTVAVKVIKGHGETAKLGFTFDENSKITLSKGVKELL
jgi:large subunit ribosomal protein L15